MLVISNAPYAQELATLRPPWGRPRYAGRLVKLAGDTQMGVVVPKALEFVAEGLALRLVALDRISSADESMARALGNETLIEFCPVEAGITLRFRMNERGQIDDLPPGAWDTPAQRDR
jgi:hypothetical protein